MEDQTMPPTNEELLLSLRKLYGAVWSVLEDDKTILRDDVMTALEQRSGEVQALIARAELQIAK